MADVIELIEHDHREIEDLFEKFGSTGEVVIALDVCDALDRHHRGEERAVYPAIAAEIPNGRQMAGEGEDEHREAHRLIARVRATTDPEELADLMRSLQEVVTEHVDAEEAEVLPQARAVLEPERLEALGRDFTSAKDLSAPKTPARER
jgi:hemerythrin superfamily protein